MTDDTLERLLIDRSLGALSEDVDALLTAYIQTRPDAREAARDLDSIVVTARHVLSARVESTAPRPPLGPLARTLPISSLAACLLIGVGIGAIAARRIDESVPDVRRVPALAEQPDRVETGEPKISTVARTSEDSDAFWSANKLLSGAPRVSSRSSSLLRWTSPVSSPLPKGKS